MKQLITTSIQKVEKWVEDHNYKGYEPFDGLSSIFRPLFGVKPLDSTIGRGYMAWGYCYMFVLSVPKGLCNQMRRLILNKALI